MLRAFIALTLLLALSGAGRFQHGATSSFFVATTGSDSNPGTQASPFQTLGKCQTAMRTSAIKLCTIRGGTYSVASGGLAFTSADNGEDWEAFTGESVAFSGGTAITGFTLCTTADSICNSGANNVYQATGPNTDFRELYTNGSHATRAWAIHPTPNWSEAASGGVQQWTATSGLNPSSFGNLADVEVVTKGAYEITRCHINPTGTSGTTIAMVNPCGNLAHIFINLLSFGFYMDWVENAYELLTSANCGTGKGCWYWNRNAVGSNPANTVYYLPRVGESNGTTVTVPVVAGITQDPITITGVNGLTFGHITFEFFGWEGPDTAGAGYVGAQNGLICPNTSCATLGTGYTNMDAAITISGNSQGVAFNHIACIHNGPRCIWAGTGTHNLTVYASTCQDSGAGCWQFSDDTNPSGTGTVADTAVFRDDWLKDAPFEYIDSGGIFTVLAKNVTVDHIEADGGTDGKNGDNLWTQVSFGLGWNITTPNYSNGNAFTNSLMQGQCQAGAITSDCGIVYLNNTQTGFNGTGNYLVYSVTGHGCIFQDNVQNATWTGNVCNTTGTSAVLGTLNANSGVTITNNWANNTTVSDSGGSGDVTSPNTTVTFPCSGSSPGTCGYVVANAGIETGVTPGP